MRLFLTGSEGQVGREAARLFAGHVLYLATRTTDNITDERIIMAISEFRPDVVLHTAALTDVDFCEVNQDEAFRVNEYGTRLVARGAAKAGAYLIVLSTDYVFDGLKHEAYVESDLTQPINVYGQSKLAGERAAREEIDALCLIRTAWVFGSKGNNFIGTVLGWLREGKPIRAVADKRGSPTYTVDLLRTIEQLMQKRATGIYHVAGQGSCSWYEYAKFILKILGRSHPVESIRFLDLARAAPRPPDSSLMSERLGHLGIQMRPWQEMVKDYLLRESAEQHRALA